MKTLPDYTTELSQCSFIELIFGLGREFLFSLFGFIHVERRMGMGRR